MVSHWLNALKVGLFGKRKATTRLTRRPTLHVEGLEGRWVPSASPVVASIVGVTGTPTVTDVQDLKADRAFAARLEARLDHVRADVTRCQRYRSGHGARVAPRGPDGSCPKGHRPRLESEGSHR